MADAFLAAAKRTPLFTWKALAFFSVSKKKCDLCHIFGCLLTKEEDAYLGAE